MPLCSVLNVVDLWTTPSGNLREIKLTCLSIRLTWNQVIPVSFSTTRINNNANQHNNTCALILSDFLWYTGRSSNSLFNVRKPFSMSCSCLYPSTISFNDSVSSDVFMRYLPSSLSSALFCSYQSQLCHLCVFLNIYHMSDERLARRSLLYALSLS